MGLLRQEVDRIDHAKAESGRIPGDEARRPARVHASRSGGRSNAFVPGGEPVEPDARGNASPRAPGPSSAKPRRAYGSGGGEGTGGGAATLRIRPHRGTPSPRGSYRPYGLINVIARAMTQAGARLFTRACCPALRVAGAGGIFSADRGFSAQEVEVAALVGLEHVIEEEAAVPPGEVGRLGLPPRAATGKLIVGDRKSTRLNSSHRCISYAVFCWRKK